MAELAALPALRGLAAVGEGGGVHVRLRDDLAIVAVLARKGRAAELAARCGIADAPRRSPGNGVTALGIGPGRWLFLGQGIAALAPLSDLAALSDHSDGYAVFEIGGPKARAALAKGVPVDLDPAVFADSVAVTVIAHVGAIVWQAAPDRFAVAVFRSTADSFRHWLAASAAEFGLTVESP